MNGCGAIKESLCEWLDEELSAEQRLAVDAHLCQCAECRAELEALRAASNAVHALPAMKAPASIIKNLRAEIRAEASADAEGPVIRAGEAFARPKPEQYWARGLVSLAAFLAAGVLVYLAVMPHVPEKNFVSDQDSPAASKAKGPDTPAEPQDALKRIEEKQDRAGAPDEPAVQRKALAAKADDAVGLDKADKDLSAGEIRPEPKMDAVNRAWAAQPKAPEQPDQAAPGKPEVPRDDSKRTATLRKERDSEPAAKKAEPFADEEKGFQRPTAQAPLADAKPDASGNLAQPAAPPAPPSAAPPAARAKGEPAKEEAKRGSKMGEAEQKLETGAMPGENGRNSVPREAPAPTTASAPKPAATAPASPGEGRRNDAPVEKKDLAEGGVAAGKFKNADGDVKQQAQDKARELAQAQAQAKRGEDREVDKALPAPEEQKVGSAQATEEAEKLEKSVQGQGGAAAAAFGGGTGGGRARPAPDKSQKDENANALDGRERRALQESAKKQADGKALPVVVRLKANQVSDFTKNLEKKARACGGGLEGAEELAMYRRTSEKQKAQTKKAGATEDDRNADEANAPKIMEQQGGQSGAATGHRLVLRVPANKKDEVLALLEAYRNGPANKSVDRQDAKEGKETAAAQPLAGKLEEKPSVNDPAAEANRPAASVAGAAEKEMADRKIAGTAGAVPNDMTEKADDGDAGMETVEIEVEIAP